MRDYQVVTSIIKYYRLKHWRNKRIYLRPKKCTAKLRKQAKQLSFINEIKIDNIIINWDIASRVKSLEYTNLKAAYVNGIFIASFPSILIII